ncbi:hypothetical protein DPU24_09715 [Salmonella enterica subsp. enterica serovar Oranienburg]|nr:hypothetical protein [Salmonella enterica subsp. enterica serovar Oranienburg]EDU7784915.1 hypothetical protein [Salmonella enterica subsp. enterica serovar Oranienburg]HAK8202981.1 hypothetical protein [Salmonella enterica]
MKLCNAVPKQSLFDLLLFCFISLSYVVSVRGAFTAFRSFKMTKAKNRFCFQLVNFSLDPFLIVDLAQSGNLWHSVPNRFFVKRQCWRGLEGFFAQIYLAKNFYRKKCKRGGLVPPPWFGLVTPSNLPAACVYAFRRYELNLRRTRCLFR